MVTNCICLPGTEGIPQKLGLSVLTWGQRWINSGYILPMSCPGHCSTQRLIIQVSLRVTPQYPINELHFQA